MNANVDTQTPLKEAQTPPDPIIMRGIIRNYKMKSTVATLGVVSLFLGIFALFFTPIGGLLLATGILNVMMGFSTPLRIRERTFIVKLTLASRKEEINYNHITKIDYQPKRITVFYGKKRVNLDKKIFNADDWQEINKIFKTIKR